MIVGSLFANGKHIGQQDMLQARNQYTQRLFSGMSSLIKKATAIEYVPKSYNKKTTIYFFTDPNCPFCKRSEEPVKKIAQKCRAKLKVLFYPVYGKDDCITAVCKKLSYDQYMSRKWKKTKETCEQGKEIVDASTIVARQLGVGGTPTFFIVSERNFEAVYGANMKKLEEKCLEISK